MVGASRQDGISVETWYDGLTSLRMVPILNHGVVLHIRVLDGDGLGVLDDEGSSQSIPALRHLVPVVEVCSGDIVDGEPGGYLATNVERANSFKK